MIIFTEHNEVIMSVDDFRNIIRNSFLAGVGDSPIYDAGIEVPASLIVEGYVAKIESYARKTKEILRT